MANQPKNRLPQDCNCNNCAAPTKDKPAKIEDTYVDDDVKNFVASRFNANDTPQAMIARNWAAQLQNSKLLKILIAEMHLLRTSFCRHAGGFCNIPPCTPPQDATPGTVDLD